MPFQFAPAEKWSSRMELIATRYGLDQPLVVVVGSGLSLDRDKQQGVADVDTLVGWIRAEGVKFALKPGENEYQAAMAALKEDRGARGVGELIRRAVLHAYRGQDPLLNEATGAPSEAQREACRQLEQQNANWTLPRGVAGLAAFLKQVVEGRKNKRNPRIGAVQVITTNFDPLVEVACKREGIEVTAHSISGDARPSLTACHVQVWHVHGAWWDVMLHSPDALNHNRAVLKQTLQQWMNDAQICILGYGGWQDLVSTTIAETFELFGGNGDVLWSFFESEEQKIRDKYSEPLARLKSARALSQVTLFRGVDLHAWGESLVGAGSGPPAAAVTTGATSSVPPSHLERFRDSSRAMLAVDPSATTERLKRLLAGNGKMPMLGEVLGEICSVLPKIAAREAKRRFACSALEVISALSACILSVAPRVGEASATSDAITVESCLVAELLVAAEHERSLRLRQGEQGPLPEDGFEQPMLEEGPAAADWIRAIEEKFWEMKDPNQVDYDSLRHKADLDGFLEAKRLSHEQCFATVEPGAPIAALKQAIPNARFFLRGRAGAISPGISERTLAELFKMLLERAPELCVDLAAKKATTP